MANGHNWAHFRQISVATLVVIAAALTLIDQAHAGYPVQPNGTTVAGQPTFLVYRDDDETLPQVEVARTPDMRTTVGSCTPYTAFGEPHKFTCRIPWDLEPGTYYWTFSVWRNDDCVTYSFGTYCYPQEHTSAPLSFTIATPQPPADAGLVLPVNGGAVDLPPTFVIAAPADSDVTVYGSDSPARNADGSPVGAMLVYCDFGTSTAGNYRCDDGDMGLESGGTYYWWAVIEPPDGNGWIYGPWSFDVRRETGGAGGVSLGSGARAGASTRTVADAPTLPVADRYGGKSVKQRRLTRAAYSLTKVLRVPKSIAVGCWSEADWPSVSGDSGDGKYGVLGFYQPSMPHWVQLGPDVCRAFDTLLYHRPRYANPITANAVETLAHETMHALGVENEAKAECFGMQLSLVVGIQLGIPRTYAESLARLSLKNYRFHPQRYRDPVRCRENGAWDLFPARNSPPWHDFSGF